MERVSLKFMNSTKTAKKTKAVRKKRAIPASPVSKKRYVPVTWALQTLKSLYPDARCALEHRNAFELLVATILSAQTTDAAVNKVTPGLFSAYPTPEALAQAPLQDLEKKLSSLNYFRSKAKHLKGMAEKLVKDFRSEVPQDLKSLMSLPGVGRKTANVVLGNAFKIASGIVVDTHVKRLSQRLGWTKQQDPEKIERDLVQIIPPEDWIIISHLLIEHGRSLCKAQKPLCSLCPLNAECPQIA
jgi:endonuclease-3